MTKSFNSDKEYNEFRESVFQKLRTDIVNVCFTKADGTERKMLCTLVESKIPEDKRPKSTTETQSASTAGSSVRVFDTEKQEWRSFRFESVISIDGV
jgi:hypothetical protein